MSIQPGIPHCPTPATTSAVEYESGRTANRSGGLQDSFSTESDLSKDGEPPTDTLLTEDRQSGGAYTAVKKCDGNKDHGTCQCSACAKEREPNGTAINYVVEYHNIRDGSVTKEPRSSKCDLEDELNRINTQNQKSSTVFTVTTVLRTSTFLDDYREFPFGEDEGDRGQPLKGRSMTTGFHTVRLTISSRVILGVLRANASCYPGLTLGDGQLISTSPFSALAHHLAQFRAERNRLVAIKNTALTGNADLEHQDYVVDDEVLSGISNVKASEHLSLLVDYLEEAYGDIIETEISRNRQGFCTFSMLWHLFRPGMTVYVPDMTGQHAYSAMVVSSITSDPSILYQNDDKRESYTIKVWFLDFDGDWIGRRSEAIIIDQFDGEKEITKLPAIPCQYIDDEDEKTAQGQEGFVTTRNNLVGLGKKWFSLIKGQMVSYCGPFQDKPLNDVFTGRIYVDSTSYWDAVSSEKVPRPALQHYSDDQSCTCALCQKNLKATKRGSHNAYGQIDPAKTQSLDLHEYEWNPAMGIDKDYRYLICTQILGGLVLNSRKWEKLNVAFCFNLKPKEKAIDSLVMKDSRKELIKSLLYNYSSGGLGNAPKPWSADFIENKGDGRILLLHGPPGVGKTYTAECISEFTGRPLLSLTCGDIGTDELNVETNLRKWFTIGEKWGAVVLIDEADVYLESRNSGDIKRNTLVSVFLRAVEYYKGILFLTTNRVGRFDDAFISRIHIVLRYQRLGPEERKSIWKGFFDKLQRERGNQIRISKSARTYVLEDKEVTDVCWNGREIRNIFQTAVALAQYKFAISEDKEDVDKAVLDRDHFEEVCKMTTDFKQYLEKLHKADEDERASRAKNWYDRDY